MSMALLDDPLFWASHYAWCLSDRARAAAFGPDAGDALDRTRFWGELFGAEGERQVARGELEQLAEAGGDVELALRRRAEHDPWFQIDSGTVEWQRARYATASERARLPDVALRLDFASDWVLVFRYGPGACIRVSLAPPGAGPEVFLGCDSADHTMPVLRWAEVEALALRVSAIAPYDLPRERLAALAGRLLSTCAWTTADDDAAAVNRLVRGFWAEWPEASEHVASACSRHHAETRWVEHAELGWIFTGPGVVHSLRSWRDGPARGGLLLTAEQHRLLHAFLAAGR